VRMVPTVMVFLAFGNEKNPPSAGCGGGTRGLD
jgi:hypothetical protein